jgi:hypothetical protein
MDAAQSHTPNHALRNRGGGVGGAKDGDEIVSE